LGVCSEVQITILPREQSLYILVIGSDGLTDYYSPKRLVKDIKKFYEKNLTNDLICKELLEQAN